MKNEEFKMIDITKETKKALLKAIKQHKNEGNTLQDVLDIWAKGCKNREYLEWGNQLTRELWEELEKPSKLKKYFLGGFKHVE